MGGLTPGLSGPFLPGHCDEGKTGPLGSLLALVDRAQSLLRFGCSPGLGLNPGLLPRAVGLHSSPLTSPSPHQWDWALVMARPPKAAWCREGAVVWQPETWVQVLAWGSSCSVASSVEPQFPYL